MSRETPAVILPRASVRAAAAFLFALGAALVPANPAQSENAQLQLASGLSAKCRLLMVDSVQFQDGGRRGWYMYIGGLRRYANMNVRLDHRGISRGALTLEVVGCTPNFIALPIATPYNIEQPLRDLPRVRAVRIVGADGVTVHRLPGQ